MRFIDYAKQYHNFDVFLVLLDDAGLSDEKIMSHFEISKQRIYDARRRLEPIIKGIGEVDPYKRDMRNKDVQAIIEAFSAAFGTTASSRYDRFAAKRLHTKYGSAEVVKLINAFAALAGEEYAPAVNSVAQLEKKLPQVVQFVTRNAKNNVVISL